MLKAIIVDDEAKSRRTLKQLVEEYCEGVTVVDMAEDVLSAVKVINQHEPDIVFLDIEMPNYSGFKLIEYFDEINFEIIFTTAYERYAFRAIKTNAIGYLLKPIDIDELVKIVEEVVQMSNSFDKKKNIKNLIQQQELNNHRMSWPSVNGTIYFNLAELGYLMADARHTKLFLKDNSNVITTYSLKECEEILKVTTFLRIHKSYIVNLAFIKKYAKGKDCFVQLENNTKIDVGKKYKDNLTEAFTLFFNRD